MIKERISLSGDFKSKVKQLMIYAGWYEGRKVDISIASQYYAERGVPMMKSTQRFYHKYFGLCCQWYFSGGMKRAADFEFGLFPYLINGIKDHLEDAYFRNMSEQNSMKSNRLPVNNVSRLDKLATTTKHRFGSQNLENYTQNMSIRMRLSAFQIFLP